MKNSFGYTKSALAFLVASTLAASTHPSMCIYVCGDPCATGVIKDLCSNTAVLCGSEQVGNVGCRSYIQKHCPCNFERPEDPATFVKHIFTQFHLGYTCTTIDHCH